MAYGKTNAGGGETHYATIAVSTDFLFDQPVTVSSTELGYTQTKIFDALGNADFIVNDWGTYNVECNGKTAEVVVSEWYQTYNVEITSETEITFTVEGAKGDNITIKDTNDEIVRNLIFSNTETSQIVTLTIPPDGIEYTFESSVAKALDGSGADYSKTITLTKDTDGSLVKIMPDGFNALWYLNQGEMHAEASALAESMAKINPTIINDGNEIKIFVSANVLSNGIWLSNTPVDLTVYNKIKFKYRSYTKPSTYEAYELSLLKKSPKTYTAE